MVEKGFDFKRVGNTLLLSPSATGIICVQKETKTSVATSFFLAVQTTGSGQQPVSLMEFERRQADFLVATDWAYLCCTALSFYNWLTDFFS